MRNIISILCLLFATFLSAQNITDAVRYSDQKIFGTARYRGMSGAFGALGGDLSAMQINPAGSAVFTNSFASLTISTSDIENDWAYGSNGFGTNTEENLNFNQFGAVFIYGQGNQSRGINKISFGMAYDQTADYENTFLVSGNTNTSIDQYFLGEAQGNIPLELITLQAGESVDGLYAFLGETEGFSAQQAFLGYESFILESTDDSDLSNTNYTSNISGGNFNQEYFYESTGLNGKFTLNVGAEINNDFFIGANLNTHFINYDRITEFYEFNDNNSSTINEVIFTNRLSTLGAGFSAQIGAIAKISPQLRLGISVESPTWYSIEEETTQRLETADLGQDDIFVVDPNIINIFPEYELRTPGSATGSLAYLFGQRGLISIDYTYKDYTDTEFSSDFDNNLFAIQNQAIEENLQAVSTIRIGGEVRNGNWSFRGGYSYEESPYKNENIMGERTGVSFGLGYNFGKLRFDFAYDVSVQERNEAFFPSSGFNNAAFIDEQRENLTFTLGINL